MKDSARNDFLKFKPVRTAYIRLLWLCTHISLMKKMIENGLLCSGSDKRGVQR